MSFGSLSPRGFVRKGGWGGGKGRSLGRGSVRGGGGLCRKAYGWDLGWRERGEEWEVVKGGQGGLLWLWLLAWWGAGRYLSTLSLLALALTLALAFLLTLASTYFSHVSPLLPSPPLLCSFSLSSPLIPSPPLPSPPLLPNLPNFSII